MFRMLFGSKIKREFFSVKDGLHNSVKKAGVSKIVKSGTDLELLFGFLFLHEGECWNVINFENTVWEMENDV